MPENKQKSELVIVRLDPKTLFTDFAKEAGIAHEDADGIGESLQYFGGKVTSRANLEATINTMVEISGDEDLKVLNAADAVDAIASPHYPPE